MKTSAMDNRFLLVIALAIIIFMIFQAWQLENREAPSAPGPPPATATGPAEVPEAPAVEAPVPTAPTPATPVAPTVSEAASTDTKRGGRIEVLTDVFDVVIDTTGGDLRQVKLRKYPVAVDTPDVPFVLLTDETKNLYVTQSGLIGTGGPYPNHKTEYTASNKRYLLADGQDELKVPLRWHSDGVQYTKVYTFRRDDYVIDIEYLVENNSGQAWQGHLYRQFRRNYDEPTSSFLTRLPTFTGGAIYTPEEKYDKIPFSEMAEEPLELDVTGGWVAMLQHYFVSAWLPLPEQANRYYTNALEGNRYTIGLKQLQPTTIAPGNNGRLVSTLYVGPKEHNRLERLAPGMELTVDYGWLTFISAPLFWLLEYIHQWVRNWGWAIIVLTLLIKLAFYPLSAASYRSMAHMKRMQPKLQSLKERMGHDKQRFNQAMMELYKKEKINPLGGCLPIAIQIPVFIALYWVLLESVEMRQAPFILWLKDLSLPDPYFVLPLLMGVSMFVQQKLSPAQLDPMQRRLMTALPIVFTVFFLFFPAGLVLYWVVNNILSIAQQWQITRMIEAKAK
ncbi:MAG: membrane protein insertase YidC [Gammaproteobacteria bacterium]|nr:membrane protein insertase YidC [Gammaproteobacteria bacterium]